jgi:zinc protease
MKRTFITALLSIAVAVSQAQAPKLIEEVKKNGNELVIPYQKYLLSNGLTVILTEDHSDPIVHVDVTYHVGSAREEIRKSGFAHFFEHMMFEGSEHVKSGDHFKIVSASGGDLNGTTNQDRTNYYETVPNNQLQKMLRLEADRMGFLLPAVTQQKFEIQRSTVKNERGQNYDNVPYGLAGEAVSKALFPYGHPYSWLTIGYIEDLNKVDVNDLKRFFLRWYGPNNATLTIGGDIDVKQTLAWIEKYFGSIPRGPEVTPTMLPPVVVPTDRYISYTDNYANLPLLYISYPGVKMYDADQPALDALTMIIGQGPNSIFYQNFIKSRKATYAGMASRNSELAGQIDLQVVPFPGQTLGDMQKMVNSSFAEFEKKGVSDNDLERFKGSSESKFVKSIASVAGKVSELASAQTFTGNPNQIGVELAAIEKVTKADVMRVYQKYIKGKGAVVLSVLPKNDKSGPAAKNNFTADTSGYRAPNYGYEGLTYHQPKDNFDRNLEPEKGPNPVIKVPPIWTAKFANGIKMQGTFNNEIPAVSVNISIKGGGLLAAKNPKKAGLPYIVAQMLDDDTKSMTNEKFNAKLEELGSTITVNADDDEIIYSMSSLTKNIDPTVALLKERLFHPKFTQSALDRIKKQAILDLEENRTQPANVATDVFNKILYGAENIRTFGLYGTEKTLAGVTLADVQSFYDMYFSPNITKVVVVGDVQKVAIQAKLSFLKTWKAKQVIIPDAPNPTAKPLSKTIYVVDVPNSAQSEIRVGYYTAVPYNATGLYYKLHLTNYSLGGDFNSLLNIDLREEKGWTYGAYSQFNSDRSGGVFIAQAGVRASSTDSAAMEFYKDIKDYARQGISAAELEFTKSSIGQSDARRYETNSQKARFLLHMMKYNLTPDYVGKQSVVLKNLQMSMVDQLAKKYLDTDKMTMLIVGDKAGFVPALQKAGFKIIELNNEGHLKK